MDLNTIKMLGPTCENGVWKGTKVDVSDDYFNLGEKIFKRFKEFPEIIGQIDAKTGEKETFAAMGEKAIRCALWLKKHGIKPGDVVGSCSGNHLDSWIPMVASFYMGAIFNPWWDSCFDEDLARYFIKLTEPKVLFITEDLIDTISEAVKSNDHNDQKMKVIVFGTKPGFESFKNILKSINTKEVEKFQCKKIENPQESAIIMYTSGTTSHPKGALHTYGSFARLGSFESKRIVPNTTNIWFSGICWLSGILTVLHSLFSRSTMIVCSGINEEEACKFIEKYKVSLITMGTSVANRMSKTKAFLDSDMSSVMYGSYGGAIAKKEVVEFLHKVFKNVSFTCIYGCTEIGVIVACKVNLSKPTSCGNVIPNAEIKLINPETGKISGPKEEGEIWYRGPTLMAGYYKNPESTKEAIDSEGWYHTGDLGYYDEDGDFFIVERIKELIKYRLHHVPPAAIENIIQNHPAVAEVAVVAKPDINDLEQPLAFITKIPGAEVTETEIHELVKNNLHDRFKLRGGIYFLDKMPHAPSGKIAKRELRVMVKKFVQC